MFYLLVYLKLSLLLSFNTALSFLGQGFYFFVLELRVVLCSLSTPISILQCKKSQHITGKV